MAAPSPACPTRSRNGRAGGSGAGAPRLRLAVLGGLGRSGCELGLAALRSNAVGSLGLLLGSQLRLGPRRLLLIGFGGVGTEQHQVRTADRPATLADASPLADLLAQIEELGAAHLAVAEHLDLVEAG